MIPDFARHYFRNFNYSHFFAWATPIDLHSSFEELNVEPGRHIANLRLAFLPSSLTKTLPFTLGYSPSSPVSVLSTDSILLALEVFPGILLYFVPLVKPEFQT